MHWAIGERAEAPPVRRSEQARAQGSRHRRQPVGDRLRAGGPRRAVRRGPSRRPPARALSQLDRAARGRMHYDLSVFRGPAEGLRDDRRLSRLDLDATREILLAAEMEVDGDELIWARDALVAQFLLSTDGDGRLLAIEGGVVTEDAPRELRARVSSAARGASEGCAGTGCAPLRPPTGPFPRRRSRCRRGGCRFRLATVETQTPRRYTAGTTRPIP
jgi:hypothetical protein